MLSVFAGSAVLARYNLRLGQGDRLGARRLGILVVCLGVLSAILRAHHVPNALEEITYLFGATGWALAWGGLTWLVYISLEPYLRRLWPRTLISWNRFLAGQVRDPLVGRDVLIGMLAGIISRILVLIPITTGTASGASTTYNTSTLESLGSVPHFLNLVLPFQLAYSLVGALAAVSVLLLIRLVVRKTWIAVGMSILVAIPVSRASLGWPLIFVLAAPLVTVTVFLRVGLLAYVAAFFTDLLLRVAVTLDPNAWYFGYSLVVLLIMAAVAGVAFLVSLGGRPAFGASPA
jgi:serine/threonine-protein kinase